MQLLLACAKIMRKQAAVATPSVSEPRFLKEAEHFALLIFALYGIAWNKSASSEAMTDDWLGGWTNKSDYSSQKKRNFAPNLGLITKK